MLILVSVSVKIQYPPKKYQRSGLTSSPTSPRHIIAIHCWLNKALYLAFSADRHPWSWLYVHPYVLHMRCAYIRQIIPIANHEYIYICVYNVLKSHKSTLYICTTRISNHSWISIIFSHIHNFFKYVTMLIGMYIQLDTPK